MTTDQDKREVLTQRVYTDLIGPTAADEFIDDVPSERYLSGILFPRASEVEAEDDEALEDKADEGHEQGTSLDETARMALAGKPSTMGLSFAVRVDGPKPEVKVRVKCGTYTPERKEGVTRGKPSWRRTDHDFSVIVAVEEGYKIRPVGNPLPGLDLATQISKAANHMTLTVALVNQNKQDAGKFENEQRFFFQVGLEVIAGPHCALVARPRFRTIQDDEDESNALLYRNHREFAVGHTCAASWESSGDTAEVIRSTWMPRHIVKSVSSDGDAVFAGLGDALSPAWLAEASPDALARALASLPAAYKTWLAAERKKVDALPKALKEAARRNLTTCEQTAARIEAGAAMAGSNAAVRKAFQLANRAIDMQRRWQGDQKFKWRPFQLGFQLLCLSSIADGKHPDRGTMDLLWFPTGGGKTEAYLALTAFTLILRRLTEKDEKRATGVSVLMRYTLRLLTIQQFQRAASLILACEQIRKQDKGLGQASFSIGLWVGGDATPNTDADARGPERKKVLQLNKCPACRTGLKLEDDKAQRALRPACRNEKCVLNGLLPIYTVDEYIYNVRPSLVIGTLDKFAQIARKPETATLFGRKGIGRPPDMIIQDELHLISGPLGTLAGLYEVAIDAICSREGQRPKIIGSTATIRRAAQQIRDLFDRDAHQFPPPCIDVENSCFSVVNHAAQGRLYLGLTTAGRSARFSLQAVCASALQSANDPGLPAELRNYYSTLVAYFNTLRELGGALVLMQDDVGVSLKAYSARRGETPRIIAPPLELTSRTPSDLIPEILDILQEPGQCDVVLASNMISVGVDIPRLGLMVVNGQPKGIAEYIQATSRVGRNDVPGVVLTAFNHARARDRSRFETFSSWHATLYRDVESTSVTPFAPRARDKALHAILVALVRHLQPEMGDSPVLNAERRKNAESISRAIFERAKRVDPDESPSVFQRVMQLLDGWAARRDLKNYWDDSTKTASLMISAEAAAAQGRDHDRLEWPTPNSMREVEAGTPFVITEGLREDGGAPKSN